MSGFNAANFIVDIAVFFIPFLFALTFHEFAHGWMAQKLGDDTASLMGRLTMNPIAHIDPVGTIVLPIFSIISGFVLFGWAKPVPVNPRNLKNPRNDMFWIALAGPLSNILLAFMGWVALIIFFKVNPGFTDGGNVYFRLLDGFLILNLVLAFFNLLPFHPLDGGKVMARFLPIHWNNWLEANQGTMSIILIILFVSGGFRFIFTPIIYLRSILLALAQMI